MRGLSRAGIRRLVIALAPVIVAVVTSTTASPALATSAGWPIDNLGQPVQRVLSTSQGIDPAAEIAGLRTAASPLASPAAAGDGAPGVSTSAVGTTPSGDPEAYFLNMGNYSDQTAEFVGVDLVTGKTAIDTRLPSGYGATGMVFSRADDAVFMATGEGTDLYEYQAGGTTIQNLGLSISGQTIWTIAAAPDGTIWGGTYPGGDIFSYDPATQSLHNYGQALSGETYITAIYPTATTVYFGTQPNTDFGELDRSTGAITQIPLPTGYAGQIGKVAGLSAAGSRLFVAIEADENAALVWDTSSQSWVATIANFSSNQVSPPDPSNPNDVYYQGSSGITRYDISTLTSTATGWAPNAIAGAWAWADLGSSSYPGQTLMFTYYTSDRIYGYNFQSNTSYYLQPQVQGSGDQLITLGEGPDGNVYAGAYLTPPGMGQWDPSRNSWRLLSGSGQVEGYGTYNGNLVFGRYPQGDLYYDNLAQPWGSGNPGTPIAIGDHQNRPVAFAEINGLEAVGSVPESGLLGGDISLWNPVTSAITVYSSPIPDQTPVSLVAYDGLLWGGTSIDGGYGITPTATSGELFAFDPSTGKVVFSMVPKKGAVNVSGLALDGHGHLWGLADSTLFEFDLASRHIIGKKTIDPGADGSMYGIEDRVLFDSGRLFATTDYQLYNIDPVTWNVTELYSGPASDLTQDRYGQLYFVQHPSYVYRYDLPTTVYTPTVTASVTRGSDRSVLTLQATEPGGVGISETDYRIGHGPWRVYHDPIVIVGDAIVSYRAVDNAWSASPIGRIAVGGLP